MWATFLLASPIMAALICSRCAGAFQPISWAMLRKWSFQRSHSSGVQEPKALRRIPAWPAAPTPTGGGGGGGRGAFATAARAPLLMALARSCMIAIT